MNIGEILARVDRLLEENRGAEAEELMAGSVRQAVEERDDDSLLQLLNELVGFYRETGRKEDAMGIAAQAVAQAKRMGLEGTIPYATTLLNVATACRAFGMLRESMGYYRQVQEIYNSLLEPDSMLMAGLYNNMSLLSQEMGDFAGAKEKQLAALSIVEGKQADYETGVTYANLAGSCMQLGQAEEAYGYAARSIEVFRRNQVEDSHYAAALATMGAYCYHKADFEAALGYYRQAADIIERNLGRNYGYQRMCENAQACERAMADKGREDGKPQTEEAQGEGGKPWTEEAQGEDGKPRIEESQGEDGKPRTEESQSARGFGAEGDKAGERLSEKGRGLALAREYYETFGRPMIEERFADYAGRIAVGLAGRGSDCFGYDDGLSRDHDWGPDFCMWVTDETYGEIGEALQEAYERLPAQFKGYKRAPHVNGGNRRGVLRISEFYKGLVGTDDYDRIDWRQVQDHCLAAAVNGQVFRDDEGIFTAMRQRLAQGYPEEIRYLKLAESGARFSQAAQYNYPRMLGRGDVFTGRMMAWDGLKEAMRLQHYVEGKYPPHDKWLRQSLLSSEEGRDVAALLEGIADKLSGHPGAGEGDAAAAVPALGDIERLGEYFAMELYQKGYISDTEGYLDAHSKELVYKASLASKPKEELAEEIAKLEFEAFDKVRNEGGRASCQNDWYTFSIMRKSQYLTWNRGMLMQYLYDFYREYHRGHNLIEEKYGRMMESTAPERYEEIKKYFPELTQEKKDIIEQIVKLQVGWMEEFAAKYPVLAGNARSIHTSEDDPFNTSYETYLRGELGTYSDKMLELYGRYVVDCARAGGNLAYDIMKNSVEMYGYAGMDEAESKAAGRNYGTF